MKPAEHSIFLTVFAFGGTHHHGMTAKEIQDAAGISPASFYRYLPTVPGLTECAFSRGAKRYYINPELIQGDSPVAVETRIESTNISDSVEWLAVPEVRNGLLKSIGTPVDEARLTKLLSVLVDPETVIGLKAVAAQVIDLHYLNQIEPNEV